MKNEKFKNKKWETGLIAGFVCDSDTLFFIFYFSFFILFDVL